MKFIAHHSSSRGNFYSVLNDHSHIIIECGVSMRRIREALSFTLSNVDGCLISHSHGDHSKAAKDLAKAGIELFGNSETFKSLGLEEHHRCHAVEPLKCYKIGTFVVVPFETHHDVPGSMGYFIADGEDRLLFATDTSYIKSRFAKISILCIECNYSKENIGDSVPIEVRKRLFGTHMAIETVEKFIQANDMSHLREVHLLHLSRDNSDAEEFRRRIMKLTGTNVFVYVSGE